MQCLATFKQQSQTEQSSIKKLSSAATKILGATMSFVGWKMMQVTV